MFLFIFALFFATEAVSSQFSHEWSSYKLMHNKTYVHNLDEAYRKEMWNRNKVAIQHHKQASFKLALNKYSDMSSEEFKQIMLPKAIQWQQTNYKHSKRVMRQVDVPSAFDWRSTSNCVTPVKDQGQCGSCWSFSATGALEVVTCHHNNNIQVSLSEQQLIDCDKTDAGCNGGVPASAFDYIQRNHGIDSEASYPYVSGETGRAESRCAFKSKNLAALCSGYMQLDSEEAIVQALALNGAVSVAIDASLPSFQQYSSGVYNDPECSQTQLDHAVLLVGYTIVDGVAVYIVKNSWGTSWGEAGYFYLPRNVNACGVANMAIIPLI